MSSSPETILILITGGTLDKDYVTTSGELTFSKTHLPMLLESANITHPIQLETLMLKDSLEMNTHDRQTICEAVQKSPINKIIVTHGTDTMTQSANAVQNRLKQAGLSKTVVFTGAMRPFQLGKSDASFNIGCAISAVQLLPAGSFIAMNGNIYPAGKVIKNLKKGVFEQLPK